MSRRADLVAFIDKESKTKRNFLTPSEQKLKVLLLYLKELVLVDPKPEELLKPLLERVWFEIANTPFNYIQQPYSVFTKVFWAIAHYLRLLDRAACELLMPGVTVSGPENTDMLQEAVEPDGFFL